jgi:hypothetical protein
MWPPRPGTVVKRRQRTGRSVRARVVSSSTCSSTVRKVVRISIIGGRRGAWRTAGAYRVADGRLAGGVRLRRLPRAQRNTMGGMRSR